MMWRLRPSVISGSLSVPGDKSISHRALMLAGLAEGVSEIRGLPGAEDVRATASCMRALGVEVRMQQESARVSASGFLAPPDGDLYAANSGTTMRLLAGILAGQPYPSRLTGDASLSRRPMERIIVPLTEMGAQIRSHRGHPPLEVTGGRLHGISYRLNIASAQVKSAVLLAALFAEGDTLVVEPTPSRDHTERLLGALNVDVGRHDGTISLTGGQRPRAFSLDVPGDISSASFFFAAAALTGGAIRVNGVGVNPTRAAFLHVLARMGAEVGVRDRVDRMGEPVADVTVCGRVSRPITVCAHEIPLLIDELPLVALLATQAAGHSTISGARELRFKESDRIRAVAAVLGSMGADVEELDDGFAVRGPVELRGAHVDALGDHRIAMMGAVAGAAAHGETVVSGAEAADVSFPDFASRFAGAGGSIDVA